MEEQTNIEAYIIHTDRHRIWMRSFPIKSWILSQPVDIQLGVEVTEWNSTFPNHLHKLRNNTQRKHSSFVTKFTATLLNFLHCLRCSFQALQLPAADTAPAHMFPWWRTNFAKVQLETRKLPRMLFSHRYSGKTQVSDDKVEVGKRKEKFSKNSLNSFIDTLRPCWKWVKGPDGACYTFRIPKLSR